MKNKSLKSFLISIALISIIPVLAQENYVSGYVLKLNGDTLNGFVDYRNWAKNPNVIRFKSGTANDIREFKPLDIIGFGIMDEIYKSAVVKVDDSSKNGIISDSPIFTFRTDTVFLQTLYQGAKSLYFYKDRNDQDNFYIYNNAVYELLEYKLYIKKALDQHEFLTDNKRYVGQLLVYLQDCASIELKLKKIEYTDKSIQNLFDYYYSKTKSKVFLTRPNERIKTEFGVVAGPSLVNLKFIASDNSSFNYLTQLKFGNSLNYSCGAFMNIVFPRNNGKWSMYNELVFCSNTSNYVFDSHYINNYFEYRSIDIGAYYVKMNNMLRYKYPIGKMFVFGNLGISNSYAIIEINKVVGIDNYTNPTAIVEKKLLDDTRKYDLGSLLGVGLIYNRLSIEYRWESGSGLSPYLGLGSNTYRSALLVGYRF